MQSHIFICETKQKLDKLQNHIYEPRFRAGLLTNNYGEYLLSLFYRIVAAAR